MQAKSKRKKKVQCFKCGEWGHVKECPVKEANASVAASMGDFDNDNNLL